LVVAVALYLAMTNLWWTGLAAGEAAPDFSARDLQGNEVRLSDYLGRPVMLTFWSPECSACREELPALHAIADAPGAGLALLTVVSYPAAADVQAFVEEQGLTFPVLMDEASMVTDLYKVHGVPFTYLINAEGEVERKVIGAGSPAELQNQLAAWLRTCTVGVVCQE
jgi:peroxiredoxin